MEKETLNKVIKNIVWVVFGVGLAAILAAYGFDTLSHGHGISRNHRYWAEYASSLLLNLGTELLGSVFLYMIFRYLRESKERTSRVYMIKATISLSIIFLFAFSVSFWWEEIRGGSVVARYISSSFLSNTSTNLGTELLGSVIIFALLENVERSFRENRQKDSHANGAPPIKRRPY